MPIQIAYGMEAVDFITNSQRPRFRKGSEIATNSQLDRREWSMLDAAVVEAVRLRLNAVSELRGRGLVKTTTLAEMLSQWRVGSERTRPSVSMDGRTQANRDRTDKKVYGVPVPIIRADYTIGARELASSRALGASLDTTEATEAGVAVAEEAERMLFDGEASVVVHGSTINGLRTLPARTTDTAANFGGGDFGTITNITPTFLGMLNALSAKRYHGPFGVWISDAQYHEMLEYYSDGSGQTPLQRVEAFPQIEFVRPSDFLPDGEIVMVQLTSNVIQMIVALDFENREWQSGDGQELNFAVMAAMAPKLVTDYSGNAGIAHATGA